MRLYATTTSDKKGRSAVKGGDSFIFTQYTRGNDRLGEFRVYEIAKNGGYRIYWHKENGEQMELYNSDNDTRNA